MLASLECPFTIVYDPRKRREDLSVKERIEGFREAIERVSPQTKGLFRGMDIGSDSKKDLGLQLADLIAGETREFLAAYPEMMSHGATQKIISQTSRERYEAWDILRMEGVPLLPNKIGAMTKMTKMTKKMVQRFLEPDPKERTVLHAFAPLLVSGSLSCYSATGTPRHVMPFIGGILDQTDR